MRPMRRASDILREARLAEAYKRVDKMLCYLFFIRTYQYFLNTLSEEEYLKFQNETKMFLEILDLKEEAVGAYYDADTRETTFQVTNAFLKRLITAKQQDVKDFASDFWFAFVHEDTHKQQTEERKVKLGSNYVKYLANDPFNLDISQNLKYFNQIDEATAYGRELGSKIWKLYNFEYLTKREQESMIGDVFENIKNNKIEDAYLKNIINIYKDPRIDFDVNY